uniref:peptidoglycan recognition protein family protein n=1 Tax=Trichocoleus desertorum TaxID=1481672 RepID=UPI0025B43580|nr:peptidoglycan recognition family protein [Trichocoleus desertorum]
MIQITSFPSQVRNEEFLVISGTAVGYEGRPLTVIFDDRFENGAGAVAANGTWSLRFRFTQLGTRRLVFAIKDAQGNTIRSQAIAINVIDALPKTIEITSAPKEVVAREMFALSGTALGSEGKPVVLTIDNQFKINGGIVATDGSWRTQFQFLQSGTRRMTASIDDATGNPVLSETVTITVASAALRLSITPPSSPIQVGEGFVLQGEAKGFENGQQLVIRVDKQYVISRPIVQDQRWQATLFFNQGGKRLVELIASDQEKAEIELTVDNPQPTLQIFPYTLWTSTSTPDVIPDLINPQRITLHHTVIAALPANATQAQEIQRIRFILDIHLKSSGYSDIGYHYIVMPSGRVYEGRSSLKKGAHDVINDGFGVAVDGDFQNLRRITSQQFDSVVAICTILCKRMRIIDPTTPVGTLVEGMVVRQLPRIIGHRDRVATGCPGTLYQRMNEIRQAVRTRL